jgi:hypothetical protein
MIEARIFTDSLNNAKTILQAQKAVYKGTYKIIDEIFRNKNKAIPLIDEFLRLRVLPENIWDDKDVVLAIKKTRLRTIGKNSEIPLKLQFNRREDAEAYYDKHLRTQYIKDFSFSRVGWQYIMNNGDVVDLEIIEDNYPSIEFKSETTSGMEDLLTLFNVSSDQVIIGPSAVAVKDRLSVS